MPAVPSKSFAKRLRANENIAVAAWPIPEGTAVQLDGITVTTPGNVKMGHKFAVVPIKEGDAILKYGQIIGFAGRDIAVGEHVHVHNVILGKFDRDYAFCSEIPAPLPPPVEYRSFMVYDHGPSIFAMVLATTSRLSAP